jgi:ppGpp synthetase/RelA/SpoT-type nucleotidyltranferase
MMDLEETRRRWTKEKPQFERLGLEVAHALRNEIRREGIWADVRSRSKETDSLIRKLIRKPGHTYESIGDRAGVRVIVRYKNEIDLILEIADRIFSLSDIENTADRLGPDVVGYLSVHGTIRFRPSDPKASTYPPGEFSAELQVRTLAQHLWSEMAHDAVYKNDEVLTPLPPRLRRRIYILAGAIELADEEFNRIEREVPQVPEVEILKALEHSYYKLTTRRGDPETSLDVIGHLAPLYGSETRNIIAHLVEFFINHEEILLDVYGRAEDLPERSVFLFQPEALMIYDLLETKTLETRKTWNEHYPEKELERIANEFGISFD